MSQVVRRLVIRNSREGGQTKSKQLRRERRRTQAARVRSPLTSRGMPKSVPTWGGPSGQNRTIVDTQTRTSAHMTDVVRCIHLDQKTVGIMKFERFLGITVEFQIEFR